MIESVLAFALLLGFMVFIHELGHFVLAKLAGIKVEEFGIGFPPRLLSFRRGETEYTLNALPLGGFVRMLGEEDPRDPRSFARARKRWRIAILLAGSTMNLIAAALFFTVAHMAGWPTVTGTEVEVFRVVVGSPAESGGLQAGDIVLGASGQSVAQSNDLRRVTEASLGRPIVMQIRRGGAAMPLTITPRLQWPEGEGPMGVAIRDRPARIEPLSYAPPEAAWRGAREVVRTVALTLSIPALAIQGLLPLELLRPVGPVGLYQATAQATAETVRSGWWFPLLYMGATLGAGLAVANLLPIPGLDGGRLLFIVIEALRRRRVSPEREGFIHLVGLMVLVSLVVVVTYFDVLFPVSVDFSFR